MRSLVRSSALSRCNFLVAGAHTSQHRSIYKKPKPSDEEPHLLVRSHDIDHAAGVITILTLNRPTVANAMGHQMLQELTRVVHRLNTASGNDTRCVLLTSCSDAVFSAGADLKERRSMTLQETSKFVDNLRYTLQSVASLPMPVLAVVEGVAVGGGLELALAADLRIAGTKATMGLPETSLAIIPGAGGTQRLPRLVGVARAKELIWTGRRIDAHTALEYGIVDKVAEVGTAEAVAMELAEEIAVNGPVAVRASKQAINRGMAQGVMSDALACEAQAYHSTLDTVDRLEGLKAFKEKRKPEYKGI